MRLFVDLAQRGLKEVSELILFQELGRRDLRLIDHRPRFDPEVQDRREREFMELVSRYEGEYDGSEIAV